jgi:integrase
MAPVATVEVERPTRSYLDAADHIVALLDAAGELDREARDDRRHVERRAMLATLTFAGLRVGELLALRWRDLDLASGWLTVGDSKTDAGRRRVKIRGALRDDLVALRARREDRPGRLRVPDAQWRAARAGQLPQPRARRRSEARR